MRVSYLFRKEKDDEEKIIFSIVGGLRFDGGLRRRAV